ncbi:sulfotransferase domain-containing protein [Paenibacillus harenae]|uniref:Sulfotransferase domain-containing protein n=1 Tax=Paenibacillus harenae TaxID=306543 RepID=A0ABT9U5P0_PAEHA|nr:sulfotransferase domain-containing protein [Paenibacillus harenae]MDQ0114386.1 hypothetical protein [Paenibacillus harenae]
MSNEQDKNNLFSSDNVVMLVSYPKSGNTWVRFLLSSLLFDQATDWTNFHLTTTSIYYPNFNSDARNKEYPYFIKSHSKFDGSYAKVIYLVRDVRDVVISFYFYHKKVVSDFDESFDQFLERFCAGETGPGHWDEHINGWLRGQNNVKNGFLMIKYEDLHAHTGRTVRKILKFLGIKKSALDIYRAIRWSSFENMRKLELAQQDQWEQYKNSKKDIAFMRNGAINEWKHRLTPEQKEKIMNRYGQTLQALGYDCAMPADEDEGRL